MNFDIEVEIHTGLRAGVNSGSLNIANRLTKDFRATSANASYLWVTLRDLS